MRSEIYKLRNENLSQQNQHLKKSVSLFRKEPVKSKANSMLIGYARVSHHRTEPGKPD